MRCKPTRTTATVTNIQPHAKARCVRAGALPMSSP